MYDAKLEPDNCWIKLGPNNVWYPTTNPKFYRYACSYGKIEDSYCCHNFSDQICVNHKKKNTWQAPKQPLCAPVDMGAPLIAQENGR